MAIALIAWLMAPAPIAWTSTFCWLRTTPAMAPATATGFEVAETLRTSTGALTLSADAAATSARSSPGVPADRDDALAILRTRLPKVNSGRFAHGRLLRVLDRACLTQHGHLDLARIG